MKQGKPLYFNIVSLILNNLQIFDMKKKDYQKTSMQVVELKQQSHLLAGSNGGAGTQDYDWHDFEDPDEE